MQTRRDFLKTLPGFLVVPALLDGLARQPLAQAEQDDLLYAAGARLVKGATVLAELKGPARVFDMQAVFEPFRNTELLPIRVRLCRALARWPLLENRQHPQTGWRFILAPGAEFVVRAGDRLLLIADSSVPVWGSGLLLGRGG